MASGQDAGDMEVEAFMNQLTPENLDTFAKPIESTTMIYTQSGEGMVLYAYELETGESGKGTLFIAPDQAVGQKQSQDIRIQRMR